MKLVDDEPLLAPLIFDRLITEWPELFIAEEEILELVQLPEPWLLHGETPLRAQMRLLSGRPDVTAWTVDAGRKLAAALEAPPKLHRTLLGLGDDVDGQPPTVATTGVAAPVAVSAEGDEGPPNL